MIVDFWYLVGLFLKRSSGIRGRTVCLEGTEELALATMVTAVPLNTNTNG